MRVYIGPWEWRTDAVRGSRWCAPDGVESSLDLRSIAQCSQPGPVASGIGVFLTDVATLPNPYIQIADGPDVALTNPARNNIRTQLGLATALEKTSCIDVIWELLTLRALPDGLTICPPLMPSNDGYQHLHLGVLKRSVGKDISSREWLIVRDMLQREYRSLWNSDQTYARKRLSVWMEQFALDFTTFIPSDLPIVEPLPHDTLYTETFNTANSTTLGPNLSWTEYQDWIAGEYFGIVSNECDASGTGGSHLAAARANVDTSTNNLYAQVTVTNLGADGDNAQAGVMVRHNGSNTAYYVRATRFGWGREVAKIVAGTATSLQSGGQPTVPFTVQLRIDGSALQQIVSGLPSGIITDSSIASGTRGGVVGYRQTSSYNVRMDNFEVGDTSHLATIGYMLNYHR